MNWHKVGQVCVWGLIYFAIVFSVGFLLGIFRVTLLEPILGTRWAELLEMPLMLAAIVLASKWIVRKTQERFTKLHFGVIGLVGLAMLVAAELSLVILLRGMALSEYIASRDPVSGAVYLFALIVFALMPWIVSFTSANNQGLLKSNS